MAEKREVILEIKLSDEQVEQLGGKLDETGESAGKAGDAISGLGGPVANAIKGIQGMAKAGLAFIATPIGAVIGALSLALGTLFSFLTKTQKGIEIMRVASAAFGAIVDVLIDRVSMVGEMLFEAFSNPKQTLLDLGNFLVKNIINRFTAFAVILEGIIDLDFKKVGDGVIQLGTGVENATDKMVDGFNSAKEVIVSITEEIREEIKLATELENALIGLEKRENDQLLLDAERRNAIEKLIGLTRDFTLADNVRSEALAEATALEIEGMEQVLELQRERVRVSEEDFERAESTEEDRRAMIEERVKLIDLETASLARQRELQNRFNEQESKFAADREKERKEEQKQVKEHHDSLFAAFKGRIDKEIETLVEASDEKAELDQKQADAEKEWAKVKGDIEESVTGILVHALDERTVAGKAARAVQNRANIKETIGVTRAGAVAAYKSLAGIPIVGPVLGALAAAAVIAYGALAVQEMAGLSFKEGGYVIGGRRHSEGGTQFYGSDGTRFEAERGEGLFVMNRGGMDFLSSINDQFRTGASNGTFAQGGGVPLGATQRNEDLSALIADAVREIPAPRVLVTDIDDGLSKKVQVEDRADL